MAVTKVKLFDKKQKRTAELAKALAHPARIAILELLAERATCICGDITDELPLAQSTISQHLKALKKSGLIEGEVDGVRTCYCLNNEVVQEFRELLLSFSKNLVPSTTQKRC
jgi:ArsR family transcriptional regulator